MTAVAQYGGILHFFFSFCLHMFYYDILCILNLENVSYACMGLNHFSHVWLFETRWTAAQQIPLSMWLSWQEYWGGLSFPPPEILTMIAYKKNKCLLSGDQVARERVPRQGDGEGAAMNVDREMSSQGSPLSCHSLLQLCPIPAHTQILTLVPMWGRAVGLWTLQGQACPWQTWALCVMRGSGRDGCSLLSLLNLPSPLSHSTTLQSQYLY